MESLRELKLINNKHIPNSYKCNSKRVRLQLLAGLIDSDGYVNNKKNYIEITTKLPKLRDDILYLVRSLGYAGYSSVKNINDKNYYRINISGNLKEIPTKIKRKNIINNRTTHRNHLRTGFNIKYLGVDDYYGFELDGNHLYCLGDFTVTHNSTTATGVFSLLKMHGVNCEYASEYAKDRSWEESLLTCYNPYYICAKQYQRQFRLIGKVDVIITDSPLLLQCAYNDEKEFQDMALALFNKFNNINYIIKRKKAFNPKGRAHNLEESKKLDEKMYELLNRYNEPYLELEGDYNAVNFIVNKTLKRLDKEQKIFLGENVEVINETCSNT